MQNKAEIDKQKKSYFRFIEEQREGYECIAKMIGYIVEKLIQNKEISEDVHISGRLKSFKSAFENDSKKGIIDCFGIRIVAQNQIDLQRIQREIEKILKVRMTKKHGENGNEEYDAMHHFVEMDEKYIRNSSLSAYKFPLVEVQYWTKELEEKCVWGKLAYSKYKNKDLEGILEAYRKNPELVYSKLPICYEIKGNTVRQLEKKEALFKIYPEIEAEEKKKTKEQQEPELC